MNKNRFLVTVLTLLFFCFPILMTGCVSQSDYNTLLENYNKSSEEIESLQRENEQSAKLLIEANNNIDSLEQRNNDLNAELENLKNGAEHRIIQIRNYFEAENYQEVIAAAAELHEQFNGCPEDIEAQKLASDSQKAIDEAEAERKAEEERLAAEALKTAETKAREIIRISKIAVSKPDSAGGVELYINFINNSDKTIKYITFGVSFYNSVGDIVTCKYKQDTINYCKDTGPYEKGEGLSGTYWHWGDYYNWDIKSVKLVSVEIEYTDGTSKTLTNDEIEYVQY